MRNIPYEKDDCMESVMPEIVKEQILAIRETGMTNMFDLPLVKQLAFEQHFFDLLFYIEEHQKEYALFILYGKA